MHGQMEQRFVGDKANQSCWGQAHPGTGHEN